MSPPHACAWPDLCPAGRGPQGERSPANSTVVGRIGSPLTYVHLWLACRDRRPVSIITRILQLLGIAGGFLSKLAWDAANGRLKETEVDRAIDLRNIVVRGQAGQGLADPRTAEKAGNATHSHLDDFLSVSAPAPPFMLFPPPTFLPTDQPGSCLHQAGAGALHPPGPALPGSHERTAEAV